MKKFLKLAGIGFLAGIVICDIIMALTMRDLPATPEIIEELGGLRSARLLQMLLTGLYGALCFGTTMLYDADRMPLALASAIHCAICIVPFIFMSRFLGWTNGPVETLIQTACQLVAYMIIWLIMYLSYRKEIRELNEMQKKLKVRSNAQRLSGSSENEQQEKGKTE